MEQKPDHGPLRGSPSSLLIALAIVGLAATSLAIGVLAGRAAPATDLLGPQRERVRSLEAEVQRIDADAAAAADAHAQALARAEDLRRRIAETTDAIAQTEADRRTAIARLSERLVEIYRTEPPTVAEIVLSSGSLSEAIDVQDALERVGESDAAIVRNLRESRVRLGRLRAELVSGQAEVEASVATSRSRLTELQGLIGDRRQALAAARGRLQGLVRRRAAATADARTERALLRRARPGSGAPTPVPVATTGPSPAPAAPSPAPAAPAAVAPSPVAPAGPAPAGDVAAALGRIAQCESGGNPRAVSASGQYRGKYQFDQGTWEALGGVGDPAAAPEGEQDRIAALLYARSGPAPWPVCGYR